MSLDAVAVKAAALSCVVECMAIAVKSLQVAIRELVQSDQADAHAKKSCSRYQSQTVEEIMGIRLK